MATYKNDYTKSEDQMMYELHEIRNKLAKENKGIKSINKKAESIIKENKLYNLKIIQRKES